MPCAGKTGVIDTHQAHFLKWRHTSKQSNPLIQGDHMRRAPYPHLRVPGRDPTGTPVNTAAVNICVQVLVGTSILSSFGYYMGLELLHYMVILCLTS